MFLYSNFVWNIWNIACIITPPLNRLLGWIFTVHFCAIFTKRKVDTFDIYSLIFHISLQTSSYLV